jgi:hypothetical protein
MRAMSHDTEVDAEEAKRIFEREIGATVSDTDLQQIGTEVFLKFRVGRDSPLYQHALRETQSALPSTNKFKGHLGLSVVRGAKFPSSQEASCLLTLLSRSTRAVAEGGLGTGFLVPYVPFPDRKDYLLAQPASHLVLGRRGVGKSTLIRRALDLLSGTRAMVAVLDMQTYTNLSGQDVQREVLHDLLLALATPTPLGLASAGNQFDGTGLASLANRLANGTISPETAGPGIKRLIKEITRQTHDHVFVFLDDFHLVDPASQPEVLHLLNGALKGANGWLKVSGVRTLTNYYSSATRTGLQVPGDAQEISLDLTLENPEAAERHLRAILEKFLEGVGYSLSDRVMPESAFKRLVWANAGVPRDFLQMFARALEHAGRNGHTSVTVSDVNIAIGEFGQRKSQELQEDARNESGELQRMTEALESFCLDQNKVNAFLLKSEDSVERKLVRKLSDLRLVHLIHQSITPDRAGERYEAFIVDYSLFTGFRRRPNIKEMTPSEGQFKASELRKLPKVSSGFLAAHLERSAAGISG